MTADRSDVAARRGELARLAAAAGPAGRRRRRRRARRRRRREPRPGRRGRPAGGRRDGRRGAPAAGRRRGAPRRGRADHVGPEDRLPVAARPALGGRDRHRRADGHRVDPAEPRGAVAGPRLGAARLRPRLGSPGDRRDGDAAPAPLAGRLGHGLRAAPVPPPLPRHPARRADAGGPPAHARRPRALQRPGRRTGRPPRSPGARRRRLRRLDHRRPGGQRDIGERGVDDPGDRAVRQLGRPGRLPPADPARHGGDRPRRAGGPAPAVVRRHRRRWPRSRWSSRPSSRRSSVSSSA